MTIYGTNKPLGSTDPKDLFDNAQNLDFALNDITQAIWKDRFGRSRKSFWGMEREFLAQLLSQKQRFENFILSSGYKVVGEYTSGPLTITEYNQLIRYQNELWKLTAATSIPFTTTGNDATSWANDSAHFVSVGDAALRQELAASGGAALVGIRQSNVNKETPSVSPEMYGALDAISAADTQSLIDAFTAAKTMGVGVKLSRLYQCASNIELTAFISDVFGLGQGQTGIIFEPGCGFVVDNSSISGTRKAMRIINTSLRTRGAKDATALRFKGTHSAKYGEQLKLTDVLFATDETGAFGWDCCLHLDQASQVFMDHCSMSGLGAVPTNCCIRLTNQSRDINFTNGCASDFLDFMDVTSGSEGVTVAFNHIIAGQRGVISHDTGGNMIFILGNHFNTSISAVELGEGTGLGSNHCKIANNFCIVYNKPGDESKPYVAFDICSNENVLSSNDVLLTGFTKDATNTRLRRNASASRSASNNTVANPISDGLTRGVVVATGAANNQVYGNQRIGMSLANDIIDNGTNTRYWLLDSDTNAFLTSDIKLARLGVAGTRQIRAHTGLDTTVASGIIRFVGGADGVANDAIAEITCRETVTKTIRPSTTNAYSCGVSGSAWSGGFTQTAFTVTSDERSKTAPVEISDAMLDAWSEVKWCQYKFLDRVEEKGEDARWHFGVVAQRAVEAFARHGLDAFEFGFACYDEWGDQEEVVEHYEATQDLYDASGNLVQPGNDAYSEVITPAKKAGSKYGIRYEEAFALEAELQRRNYYRLMSKFEELDSRISSLEK